MALGCGGCDFFSACAGVHANPGIRRRELGLSPLDSGFGLRPPRNDVRLRTIERSLGKGREGGEECVRWWRGDDQPAPAQAFGDAL